MKIKYVCKAIPGKGWQIWNRKMKRPWGNYFKEFPQELIDELNGNKNPERINELNKKGKP